MVVGGRSEMGVGGRSEMGVGVGHRWWWGCRSEMVAEHMIWRHDRTGSDATSKWNVFAIVERRTQGVHAIVMKSLSVDSITDMTYQDFSWIQTLAPHS